MRAYKGASELSGIEGGDLVEGPSRSLDILFPQEWNGRSELSRRTGIRLSPEGEFVVLHHLSCLEGKEKAQRNDALYSSIGSTVIQTCAAVCIYLQNPNISRYGLSNRLSAAQQFIVSDLYRTFALEELIVVGSSERKRNVTHEDVARKLVGAIYREHGFLAAMAFITPSIKTAPEYSEGKYKGLVQEYAQSQHMQPLYRTLSTTGPAHAPMYTCEVRVGNRKATGAATKKKAAEAAAARAFAQACGLVPKAEQGRNLSKRACDMPGKQALYSLAKASRALPMPQGCLTAREFQEAFTHISYEMDNPGYSSNAVLSIIGSCVLNMLCTDYIEHELDVGKVAPGKVRTALTQEVALARTAPPELLPAVRASRSLFNEEHVNTDTIKVSVIKSIMAALWVKYSSTKDVKYADAARDFAYATFERAIPFAVPSYRSLLQEVVQKYSLDYKTSVSQRHGSPMHKPDMGDCPSRDKLPQAPFLRGLGLALCRPPGAGGVLWHGPKDARSRV